MREEVQAFVAAFDRSHLIFTDKFGDLILHTLAVHVHTTPAQRLHFLDWTYEHATIRSGHGVAGGLETGYNDSSARKHARRFRKRHGARARSRTHASAHTHTCERRHRTL